MSGLHLLSARLLTQPLTRPQTAHTPHTQSPAPSPLIVDTGNTHALETAQRHEALQALVHLMEAMLHWYRCAACKRLFGSGGWGWGLGRTRY